MSAPFLRSFPVFLAVAAGLLLGGAAASAAGKDALILFSTQGSNKAKGKSDKASPEITGSLSKPGLQIMIQRQLFRRLKELFDENGLEFATRHFMVRLPNEPAQGEPETTGGAPATAVGWTTSPGAVWTS